MDKKRVLIFSTVYFPIVGGAEVAVHELARRIDDYSFELICAMVRPGLPRQEVMGAVTVYRVGFGNPIDKFLLPFLGPLKALRLKRPQIIWSLMASYGGFAALFYKQFHPRIPMLLTLQEGDPIEHIMRRLGVMRPFFPFIFRRADAVQAISHFLARWALEMGFRGEPAVIPNGVDVQAFTKRLSDERRQELRSAFGYTEHEVVIVTASRLIKKNAVDDLVRALTHLPPQYRLLIAGVGEDEAMLRTLAKELGVADRIVYAGYKTHGELPELLQAADLFCRPSLSEGLGNAFLEAMAAGLPIIGTPVGGIPDFLKDGDTGVFCQVRNPQSLAQAVLRIQETPGLRASLIEKGEALVRRQYDWGTISIAIRSILDHLSR